MNLTKVFIFGVIVADLLAIVYFGGMWILTGSPIPTHGDDKNHIVVAAVKDGKKPVKKAPEKKEEVFDLATYIPDVERGAKVAAKCKACHTFDAGGSHRIGPNLWGIASAPVGKKEGYAYSSVFVEKGGIWDEATMDAFLAAPKKWAVGTKMQFNGIKDPKDRANLIGWLKTLK
jgi:cytochrome c